MLVLSFPGVFAEQAASLRIDGPVPASREPGRQGAPAGGADPPQFPAVSRTTAAASGRPARGRGLRGPGRRAATARQRRRKTRARRARPRRRTEEHTSELQSLMRISYAVFFLEKKTRHNTK